MWNRAGGKEKGKREEDALSRVKKGVLPQS